MPALFAEDGSPLVQKILVAIQASRGLARRDCREEQQQHLSSVRMSQSPRWRMKGDETWTCYLDVETLECPICTEPLSEERHSAPIYQCENGHPICSACSLRLLGNGQGCPSCSQPTGRIRCLAMEKVLESVLVPCKHRPHGCQMMLKYKNNIKREEHEKKHCRFRPFPCPLSPCSHEGPLSVLSSHLTDAHGVQGGAIVKGCPTKFQMGSDETCRKLECKISLDDGCDSGGSDSAESSGGDYGFGMNADFDDDGCFMTLVMLVHRKEEEGLGDWFFCTVYGIRTVTYTLRVKRADSWFASGVHKMKNIVVYDCSRGGVREASRFQDRMLLPAADASQTRKFDVDVSFLEVRPWNN